MRCGQYGELLARAHLGALGFRILATNFRFHHGEIDIVAEEGDVLVFCEVKTRSSTLFGAPECAVPLRKQAQLRRLAQAYLTLHRIRNRVCRFDVVAIRLQGGNPTVNLIRDAFR